MTFLTLDRLVEAFNILTSNFPISMAPIQLVQRHAFTFCEKIPFSSSSFSRALRNGQ